MAKTVDGFKHDVVDLGEVRIHYVRGGSGQPVLLIHGWPQTWYSWKHVMPLLAAAGHDVIAVDMRGAGDSSRPASGYDSDTVASDLRQLLEKLGTGPVRLVAHDNGGRIAYAFAARYRDMTRSMVVMESQVLGIEPEDDPKKAYWHFGFHQQEGLPEMLVAGREREYLSFFYRWLTFDPRSISEEDIDEYVRCYTSYEGMRAGWAYYRAFPESADQSRELAREKLTIPVFALGGSHCMRDTPARSMRNVAMNVSSAIVPDCGHFIPDERPDWLAREIIRFHSENP